MQNLKEKLDTKTILTIGLIGLGALVSGCQSGDKPRMRIGEYFGAFPKMTYLDVDKLGNHKSQGGFGEKNGMLYTCNGGFIDLGHLREAADRTKYASEQIQSGMKTSKKDISLKFFEPAEYKLTINYPDGWENLGEKEKDRLSKETAIQLGQYCAQSSTIWHEIITWYGFSSIGVIPENPSSFSFEDCFSDFLGTHLATKALRGNSDYDSAMTFLIKEELKKLDVQSLETAGKANHAIRGKDRWYSAGMYPFINMNKRNFNTGRDKGYISPWLVPGICSCTKPQVYPVPSLNSISTNGFSFGLRIIPHESEKSKIFKIIQEKESVQPEVHFTKIIKHIREEAIKQKGNEVDVPNLKN